MARYRIITDYPGRWGEGWKSGDVVDFDENAAKVALENGEIVAVGEEDYLEKIIEKSILEKDEIANFAVNLNKEELKQLIFQYGPKVNANHWRNVRQNFDSLVDKVCAPLVLDEQRVDILILVTDNDRDIVQKCIKGLLLSHYPFNIQIYDNKPNSNGGCNTSKCWNRFFKESTCGYVMVIDSDAFPQNDIITPMVQALNRHPNAAVVGPVGDQSGLPDYQQLPYADEDEVELTGKHLSGYCMMFRREIFNAVGYFDENFFFYGQDTDWMQRIAECNYKSFICPRALCYHGENEKGKDSSISSFRAEKTGFNRNLDTSYAQVLWRTKMLLRQKQRDLCKKELKS